MDITNIAFPAQKALEQIRLGFSTYELLAPWVLGIALVLTLFFVRRHGLIYYGGRSQAFIVPLLFAALAGAVFREIPLWTLSLLSTYPLLFIVEKGLNSYGRKQRIVTMFDTGILIALLALVHPIYLGLIFIVLRVLRRLELLHKRQVGALAFGIFTVYWCTALIIYILTDVATLKTHSIEYVSLLGGFLKNLSSDLFSSSRFLLRELPLAALILLIAIQIAQALPRSLEKQRFTLDLHLRLVIFLYVAHILYEPQGISLYLCCAFYISILSGYCFTQCRGLLRRGLIFLPYLFVIYNCIQNLLNITWSFS
ncbi:MAG: hypothetical protein Q3998_04385 [Porphyromonas sp.]|nr:hypothetical protein [Porphyromonas sp.]